MCELKEHQFCENDEFFREYPGPLSNELRLYYLKSEADKVIAHNKYKRCLAMVRWCFTKSNYHFVVGRSECGNNNGKEHLRLSKLYSKWHKCWLELAKKFKEMK